MIKFSFLKTLCTVLDTSRLNRRDTRTDGTLLGIHRGLDLDTFFDSFQNQKKLGLTEFKTRHIE